MTGAPQVPHHADVPKVRVCREIAPEAIEAGLGISTPAERYSRLTEELPLGGASSLQRVGGDIAVIARLDDELPWLDTAIDLIAKQLEAQLWAGRPWIAFRPLLLVGQPGCGKSQFGRVIAAAGGTGHATLDLSGVCDAGTLEGTARGWTNAQPCFPALAMAQAGTANPLLLIEEIDKAGGSRAGGEPQAVLLNMIEPGTARAYDDKCLLAELDLSHLNWILTANNLACLAAPLRSRLDIVEVTGPAGEHFDALAAGLLRDLAARWQVPEGSLPPILPETMKALRKTFNNHGSVRRLQRDLHRVIAASVRFHPRQSH